MINLVKKYLDINHFSGQKETFEDLFLSHPNYPSVFAITDSLDALFIENLAIKVPKEQLIELPDAFLTIYNDDMVLISKTSTSISIENEKRVKKNLTFNEFLTHWDGVVIAIESNINLAVKSTKINTKWFSYALPFILLIALSVFYNHYSITNFIALFTSGIGLLFSVFIIQEKFGIQNEIASKLCNINTNTSCNSVIKSESSNLNQWIGFSDLPLIFFSVGVLAILLQPEHSSVMVSFLSLMSVPVVAYSLWLQKFALKKWCVLCLVVSAVIIFQALNFDLDNIPFPNFTALHFSAYLFSAIILIPVWLFVKPVLETKIKAEKEVIELKKFKRNYDVFSFLSEDVPVAEGFYDMEGIQFGNYAADMQLTVIVSPSCGHCHKAFEEAYELYSKFPENVYINVLFNINPENNDNPYKVIVENLLAINNYDSEKAKEAIIDWHINKIGLELWKKKWKGNIIDMEINQQIYQQYGWCLENEFNYTPVKIINEKLFPEGYEISDLRYFLNHFSKEEETLEDDLLAQA